MDRLLVVIIIISIFAILLLAVQVCVYTGVQVWPINKVSEFFNMEINFGGDEGNGGGGNDGGGGSSGGTEGGSERQYDVDGDNFLSCEFTEHEAYNLEENYIEVNWGGEVISFNFQKIEVEEDTHPDNLPEVNLRYHLYPENPDEVIYSNIFLADDEKLYICY